MMQPNLIFSLVMILLIGCRADSSPAQASPAPSVPGFTLVLIRTGPMDANLAPEARRAVFGGHFANMQRMARERQLLLAGPYGTARHASDLRGLFVFDTSVRSEAEGWASSDPTTQAGVFVLEYHDLATAMPLQAMLSAELERLDARLAAGESPQPGEGARAWVLLTAEHADLARPVLETLTTPEGGVFLLGELDNGRLWAVLDAVDAGEARARFEFELADIGAYTLDDWYATDLIATLVH